MLKQQVMTASQKKLQFSLWKRLILIASMLLPGGSLAMLVPSQAAYANPSWPQINSTCRAGDGGPGGTAINSPVGAGGAPGGDCVFGNKGGTGGSGGDHGSAGGPGGNVVR